MSYRDFQMDSMSRDRELSMSAAFPALLPILYVWMTYALVPKFFLE